MLKVISANRLADGVVVYAGQGGAWLERLDDARVFASQEEAETGLARAQADAARNLIVDPFLVEVTQEASGLRPASLRDSIRAQGPTIDFLAFRRLHKAATIAAPKNPASQAGQPVAHAAQPKALRRLSPNPSQAKSAADFAEPVAP